MSYRDLNGQDDSGDEQVPEQAVTTDKPAPAGASAPRDVPSARRGLRTGAIAAVAVVLVAGGAAVAVHQRGGTPTAAASSASSNPTRSVAVPAVPGSTAAGVVSPSTTETPTATRPADEPSDGAPVAAGSDPLTAATTFLRMWGRVDLDQPAWDSSIEALCDERGWYTIQGTGIDNLPKFDITGGATITPQPAGAKTVQVIVPTTGGASVITFVRSGSRLLVHNFVPPGGTS